MDSPGRVVKVNLNDFSFVGSITLQYGEDALTSAAIDVYGGYLYFGTFTSPAQVIKIGKLKVFFLPCKFIFLKQNKILIHLKELIV